MRTEPPHGDELARLLASMREQVLEQTEDEPAPRVRESRLRNGVLGALAAIALLLGVGAGAAFAFGLWPDGPEPEPAAISTPTATPSAAPSPTTTIEQEEYTAVPAPDPVPAVIEISSERVAVIADDGSEFAAYSYFEEPAPLIALLTEQLGEPVVTEVRPQWEGYSSTRYEWNGFVLSDGIHPPDPPHGPGFYVHATAATVGDLVVRTPPGVGTAAGVSVGDSTADIVAEESWSEHPNPESGQARRSTRIGIGEPLPPLSPATSEFEANFGVWVTADAESGLVVELIAPMANFGV